MAVTQKQIAEKSNVSPGLVAFALNGNGRVGEATRRRILKVARELGYYENSNRAARSLAAARHGRRTRQGAFAVTFSAEENESSAWSHLPFFLPMLAGVEREARERGLDVIVCSPYPPAPNAVAERRVDGVIWLQHHFNWRDICSQLGMPLVSVMHSDSNGYVRIDERDGIRQAVRHLFELGHREIAFLGFQPNAQSHSERIEGFKEGMAAMGLAPKKQLFATPLDSFADTGAEVDKLLTRKSSFTALVCYNDMVAMNAVRRLQQRGYSVPGDISVTGFDDITTKHHFAPSITSVGFDHVGVGRRAVQVLYQLVDNYPETPQDAQVVIPVQLIARESTAPPRGGN